MAPREIPVLTCVAGLTNGTPYWFHVAAVRCPACTSELAGAS